MRRNQPTINVTDYARELTALGNALSPVSPELAPAMAPVPAAVLQAPHPALAPQNLNAAPRVHMPVAPRVTDRSSMTIPIDEVIRQMQQPRTPYQSGHKKRELFSGTREAIGRQTNRAVRYLGLTALTAVVGVGALIGVSSLKTPNSEAAALISTSATLDSSTAPAEDQAARLEVMRAGVEASQQVLADRTIQATPDTAPEEPPKPPRTEFMPLNGAKVGELSIPAICVQEGEIDSYSEIQNRPLEQGGLVGGGQATIDQLIPDETDQIENCYPTDQIGMMAREKNYEIAHGIDYLGRGVRTRSNIATPDNPTGKVSYYKPIIGFPHRDDGTLISQLPCTLESTTLFSHGSTYSAGGGDTALLLPGDKLHVTLNDGDANYDPTTCTYEFLDNTPVDPTDTATTYGPEKGILKLIRCGAENGQTGDDAYRFMSRFILKEVNGVSVDQINAKIALEQ